MQPDQMPDSYKGGRLLYRWRWVQLHPEVLDPLTGDELEPAVFGPRCPDEPLDVFTATPEEIEAVLLANAEVRALVAAALPPARPIIVRDFDAEGNLVGEREVIPEPPAVPVVPLAELKAVAVDLINARVGELRAQHITVTVGQSATYLEKQDEAARHAAGEGGPFPYLSAEADATGLTLDAVATLVRTTSGAWTTINADLEGKRRAAVEAVKAAESPVQVFQACTHLRA
ncbi:hypothetical protein [Azospirillum brasilense]|uniref:hypothetical protein n=1 Tax=Azospirillum brasilense TaxID=192 RepID=UPI000E68E393|nr:hypothetical protein [Azospirillum brasilense]NUB25115.1 hypothetical protein [Azospirillum brasilense]NUB30561.1 hypothetical protein [Azospirillum brasilense]RIW07789.1 hypothetical protein D2T81_02815 [Azospirillum brasilense]